jgi:hypothetical protein
MTTVKKGDVLWCLTTYDSANSWNANGFIVTDVKRKYIYVKHPTEYINDIKLIQVETDSFKLVSDFASSYFYTFARYKKESNKQELNKILISIANDKYKNQIVEIDKLIDKLSNALQLAKLIKGE